MPKSGVNFTKIVAAIVAELEEDRKLPDDSKAKMSKKERNRMFERLMSLQGRELEIKREKALLNKEMNRQHSLTPGISANGKRLGRPRKVEVEAEKTLQEDIQSDLKADEFISKLGTGTNG